MALTAKKVYAILKRQISDMEAKIKTPIIYRGTVATADLLPLNPDIGDMYNIESKSVYGEAGMNVAWNGVVWDTMGAPINMSLYIKSSELADWAKQQNKPTYTAEEVGALPDTTVIPSKTSELQNDSGFLTKIPDNYLSGTDKTLSVSGKAADAKATGDKITELSADISNKLNKNQGLENSGKIAGINESGDIVPMFPVSVDYNEETNCLEFGSDQKMELNKGINLDSTLTKTGYAADAGVVGEITNSLKEDLFNQALKYTDGKFWQKNESNRVKLETYKPMHGYNAIPVNYGDRFYLHTVGVGTAPSYIYTDNEFNYISDSGIDKVDGIITVPTNAKYLCLNYDTSSNYGFNLYKLSQNIDGFSEFLKANSFKSNAIVSGVSNIYCLLDDEFNMQLIIPDNTFFANLTKKDDKVNALKTQTLTIENVRANASIIFYIDSTTNTVEYCKWNEIESIRDNLNLAIIGYWWDYTCYIIGCNVVTVYPNNYGKTRYSTAIFGDSIVAGVHSNGLPFHYYDTRFGHHYNKNYGIGSTGYTLSTSENINCGTGNIGMADMIQQSGNNDVLSNFKAHESKIKSTDAIIIFAGTNDFGSGVDLDTFETALRNCYDYIMSNHTNPLIVCTPIHRQNEKNSNGEWLETYVDKIKTVCKSMSIPVIDFFNEVQIHPGRIGWRKKYIPDGLHPNENGSQLIGTVFGNALDKYLGYDVN